MRKLILAIAVLLGLAASVEATGNGRITVFTTTPSCVPSLQTRFFVQQEVLLPPPVIQQTIIHQQSFQTLGVDYGVRSFGVFDSGCNAGIRGVRSLGYGGGTLVDVNVGRFGFRRGDVFVDRFGNVRIR